MTEEIGYFERIGQSCVLEIGKNVQEYMAICIVAGTRKSPYFTGFQPYLNRRGWIYRHNLKPELVAYFNNLFTIFWHVSPSRTLRIDFAYK